MRQLIIAAMLCSFVVGALTFGTVVWPALIASLWLECPVGQKETK